MKLALLVTVIPCLQTCHWQQRIGCGTPFGRSSFFDEIVDQLLAVRIGDGVWGIAPQSEAQAALVGVIDMTMIDEGIDGGQGSNLFPCEKDATKKMPKKMPDILARPLIPLPLCSFAVNRR